MVGGPVTLKTHQRHSSRRTQKEAPAKKDAEKKKPEEKPQTPSLPPAQPVDQKRAASPMSTSSIYKLPRTTTDDDAVSTISTAKSHASEASKMSLEDANYWKAEALREKEMRLQMVEKTLRVRAKQTNQIEAMTYLGEDTVAGMAAWDASIPPMPDFAQPNPEQNYMPADQRMTTSNPANPNFVPQYAYPPQHLQHRPPYAPRQMQPPFTQPQPQFVQQQQPYVQQRPPYGQQQPQPSTSAYSSQQQVYTGQQTPQRTPQGPAQHPPSGEH
jgi:hypothetical protein